MLDVLALRRTEFRWMDDGDTIYLNTASTGPVPACAVAAETAFSRRRATPHLISFEEQFGALDRCRTGIARLVGAAVEEVALAPNTGAGLNLAAWGLPLGPGDEVVLSDGEFPANMYPWLAASRARGFAVHVVPMRDGLLDEDAILAALDRRSVRVVSLSWVGFSTGYVADLDRIGTACRVRGIHFVVDAIQGLGPLTIDLARTPVDVLACGAQKWLLSPWGTGFTYVRRGLLELIEPQPVSWMSVRDSDDFSRLLHYDLTWRDSARRFEQITLPSQSFSGMSASIELILEQGKEAVSAHARRAARLMLDRAAAAGIRCVTPSDQCAGIASLRPRAATRASAHLTDAGVIHSLREGTIRFAAHCYSTDDDLERAVRVLVAADRSAS
ncbi:MAG: aminotransferase class V-fold PLP-dependent enzyme [Gemmatimonadaceae bacterium]|nr:aminotransferase class V-fold PLP-dependent enzyme [Gemmatimonadaceae bacterium]